MEAKELQLDVEQTSSREDRQAYTASSALDKAKPSTSNKARSSKAAKVRRSPYQLPATSSAAAAGKLQGTEGNEGDVVGSLACDGTDPPPPLMALTTAVTEPPSYGYSACDDVKVL